MKNDLLTGIGECIFSEKSQINYTFSLQVYSLLKRDLKKSKNILFLTSIIKKITLVNSKIYYRFHWQLID